MSMVGAEISAPIFRTFLQLLELILISFYRPLQFKNRKNQ